jgi:hypothetical protein
MVKTILTVSYFLETIQDPSFVYIHVAITSTPLQAEEWHFITAEYSQEVAKQQSRNEFGNVMYVSERTGNNRG